MANDTLSRCMTAIYRKLEELDELEHDLHVFYAPSECYTLVWDGWQKSCKAIVESFGFTIESFLAEVDERVSPKWVYQIGLKMIEEGV